MHLPFRTVKDDIRAGYNYREYEALWNGSSVIVVLDRYNENVVYDLSQYDDTDPCKDMRYFSLPINEFMETSYKEIKERVNTILFV